MNCCEDLLLEPRIWHQVDFILVEYDIVNDLIPIILYLSIITSQANLILEYSTKKWDFQSVEISIKEQATGLVTPQNH
jgi:hypothetical protein